MNKRYKVLALLSALAIITYLDRTSISVSGPRIIKSLNLSEMEYGWLQASFSIAYGLFQIPMGIFGDRKGVKTVLLIVVIWWSLFTFLTGLSNTFAILLIVRFLFAVGESGAFPNIAIAVSRWFPVEERGRAQGYIWMFSRIGAALSPLIIVPLQIAFGWHMVFFIFGFLGILWGSVWYFWFKENPSEMPGISRNEVKLIESNRKIKTNSHPLSFRQLISNKNLWALVLMYFSYMFGAYFFLSWLPQYLKTGRGFSEKDMGIFSSLPFIFGAIGCWLGGYLSDYFVKKNGLTWGRRIVGFSGLILSGICIITASQSSNNHIAIIFLCFGLAFKDLTLPVSWTVATEIGGKNSGAISGTMHMFGQLGSTVMTIGFGYLVTKYHNWNLPVTVIGCIVIVSGFLWFLIDASKPIEFRQQKSIPNIQ